MLVNIASYDDGGGIRVGRFGSDCCDDGGGSRRLTAARGGFSSICGGGFRARFSAGAVGTDDSGTRTPACTSAAALADADC